MTRIGKIARLPREIREQVNCRLADAEPGPDLVAWLNGLPEVQEMLKRLFGGRPISEQNLSDWRQGGYADWLDRRELEQRLVELDRENGFLHDDLARHLPENLWDLLGVRVALLIEQARLSGDAEADARGLRSLIELVAKLRRSEGEAEGTHLESRKFAVEQRKVEIEESVAPARQQYYHELRLALRGRKRSSASPNGTSQPTTSEVPGSNPIQVDQGESSRIEPNQAAKP